MELKDLLPVQPEFSVAKTGKTYTIRKICQRDHAWLQEKYGTPEKVRESFKSRRGIASFVYYLLSQDERKDFLSRDVDMVDDDGVRRMVRLSGTDILLESLTDEEEAAMFNALTRAMILSNPKVELAAEEALADAEKKRLDQNLSQLTGPKSSTELQASTDTRLTSLEA